MVLKDDWDFWANVLMLDLGRDWLWLAEASVE